MSVADYFAADYAEARQKFLSAAREAGATLVAYEHPDKRGPNGEVLATDVALIGPKNATRVFLTSSATHGVEGFCGSGCQVGFFKDKLHEVASADTLSIIVHANNPHGFAWVRRVTEDNVDLNRNFQDFAKALPENAGYEELHPHLLPADWDGPARAEADKAIMAFIQSKGPLAYQAAVTIGQYKHGDGLFFGGFKPGWSNQTFRKILAEHVPAGVKRFCSIDFHTGLGPSAYGEPIFVSTDQADFPRSKRYFGSEVTNISDGTSTSAKVTGTVPEAYSALPKGTKVAAIALEYGTLPVTAVLDALRADHWMYKSGLKADTELGRKIKRQIRDAFFTDTPAWKAAVYGRAADFTYRAYRGLAE